MKTANTGKPYIRASSTNRFAVGVDAAWEVYGPFGRTYGVYERTRLGTDIEPDMRAVLSNPRRYVRLIWVRYL